MVLGPASDAAASDAAASGASGSAANAGAAPAASPAAASSSAAPTASPSTPAAAALAAPPPSKRRKGILGAVVARHTVADTADGPDDSAIDRAVRVEKERFQLVREQVLSLGAHHPDYEGSSLFNLRKFWAAQKAMLPLHYAVYVAEVAPKKTAAANVETVFSGAGKFVSEAKSTGPTLLQRITRLHYNWKYIFLRSTIDQVVKRYVSKFGKSDGPSAVTPAPPPAADAATS